MDHVLECQSCGATHRPGSYTTGCPDCRREGTDGRLEVWPDLDAIDVDTLPFESPRGERPTSMWRYEALLPLIGSRPVTMGEGGTPLVELPRASEASGATVLVKNETTNPTWSFKDRLNSLLFSNLQALDVDRIATSSTGNHGASTAAYASRAGFEDVIVIVPPETDAPLRTQIKAYGGEVVVTDYEARGALLAELVERGWFPTVNVTEAHTGQPYAYEAYKTIAFEIVEQHGVPDAVLLAVGDGDGLYGTWKGFRELAELGIISHRPKMIGVQSAERAALADAVAAGSDSVGIADGPLPISVSAGGVTCGDHALQAVRESDGDAFGIPRADLERAIRQSGADGIFLEPASALPVAAVEHAVDRGTIDREDTVVCVGTGSGVKWPEIGAGVVGDAPRIEPTIEALGASVSVDVE